MPRPKKDGIKYSIYIDRKLEEGLRQYAEERDLTMTAALERAVRKLLMDAKPAEVVVEHS